ncbi:unnamed protein product [Moneuplotes crassus]|uniref:Uncharacterized protein n=1 Tax=Euplotes crassus TaxID=5936 RepID=A0AAD1UHJ0_EUPCR|nr:unnamed protein product [Moneuplotes crassus]
MELNKLIFPAPKPTYTVKNFKDMLFYVPQEGNFRSFKYDISEKKKRKVERKITSKDFPQQVYRTPKGKFKNSETKLSDSLSDVTNASNGVEMRELPRQTEINVPSFSKTKSPFKRMGRTYSSNQGRQNWITNPKPKVDYNCEIIKNFQGNSCCEKLGNVIPCLFVRCKKQTSKILVYFHGNSEDLGQAYHFVKYIQYSIDIHIVIVEYPGYGVYEGTPNEDTVLNDSHRVIEFILEVLKWKTQDIIVMGRSIGTGPACYLGSIYQLGALALISPYTSLRGIIKNMPLGRLYHFFVKERFRNSELIHKVTSPTFILHGRKDDLIPSQHGEELALSCKAPTCLVLPTEMTHSKFVYNDDFLIPLKNFLLTQKVLSKKCCLNKNNEASYEIKKKEKENLDPTELLKSLKRQNYRFECVISEESKDSFDFDESFHSCDLSSMSYTPPMAAKKFKRKSAVVKSNSFLNI